MEKTYKKTIEEYIKYAEEDRAKFGAKNSTLHTYYNGKITGLEIALKVDGDTLSVIEATDLLLDQNEFWTDQCHSSNKKNIGLALVLIQGIKDGIRTAMTFYGCELTRMINTSTIHGLYIKPEFKKVKENIYED